MPKRFMLPPNATATTREVPLRNALQQYADAYLGEALVRDRVTPAFTRTPLPDLVSSFRNYLLNRNVVVRNRSHLTAALLTACAARGIPVTLDGWRYRTPTDN
jgi:hypothetical protein